MMVGNIIFWFFDVHILEYDLVSKRSTLLAEFSKRSAILVNGPLRQEM